MRLLPKDNFQIKIVPTLVKIYVYFLRGIKAETALISTLPINTGSNLRYLRKPKPRMDFERRFRTHAGLW